MDRPDRDGPVAIVRRLAVGGMSEVFLGQETLPDGGSRPVVVKRLLPGAGEDARALFRREREVLSALDSPFIVRLYGGSDDEIVLEYVDGPDLASLLAHLGRRGRTLPLPAALAVMEGILMGLRDLHAARGPDGTPLGLVHRDLSPGNVLVSRDGTVKLSDLGVVHREVAGERTLPGLKGTLAYMAPEQLRGEGVDPRTDLYAAGLIAYEVLTGIPARPAGLQGLAELLDARSRLPVPPSRVRPGLPEGLDAPVSRALEPDRSRRFTLATEMWEALREGCRLSPDRGALALAAQEAAGEPSLPARTLGPERPAGGLERPHDGPVPVARSRGSRPPRPWIAYGAMVGGLLVAAAWVLAVRTEHLQTPSEDRASASEVLDAPPGDIASGDPAERTDSTRADEPSPIVEAGPPARSDSRTSGRGPRRAGGPDREAPEPVPSSPAVLVTPAGEGAVHVSGAGLRGLAPLRVPLAGREPMILDLHAGPSALPVRVRVEPRPGGPVAFIGAPEGRYYRVSCGGSDLGATPVGPVRIGERLACRVAAADGSTASFALRVEGR